MRHRPAPVRWWFPVARWMLVVIVSLIGMEGLCRIKAFLSLRYDPYCLTMPFRFGTPSPAQAAAGVESAPSGLPSVPAQDQAAAAVVPAHDQASAAPPAPVIGKQFLVVPAAEPVNYPIAAEHYAAGQKQPKPAPGAGTPDVRWYFKWVPGTYTAPPPHNYGWFRINSLGLRGGEFTPRPRAGHFRIICLGGSSTFGNESPDDQTYPAQLERQLGAAGSKRVEVINAGVPGYTSFQILNLARYELMGYQPDLLLFYEGFNDLNPNLNNLNYADVERAKPAWVKRLHGILYYRWSMLYTLGMEKFSVWLHDAADPVILYRMNIRQTFLDNVEQIIGLAKTHGVPLYVVRQVIHAPPEAFFRDVTSRVDARRLMRGLRQDRHGVGYPDAAMIRRHAELMEGLEALCRRHEVPMIDVRPPFSRALQDGTQLFYDWVHLTPAANDLLARAVAEQLALRFPEAL